MAKSRATGGVNKSEFIRNVLTENRNATIHDLNKAWADAGNDGELNPTLYYQAKGRMGLTKGRKRRRGAEPAGVAPVAMRATEETNPEAGLLAIEQELDKLIGQATSLGDSKLAESLRVARRRIAAKLL